MVPLNKNLETVHLPGYFFLRGYLRYDLGAARICNDDIGGCVFFTEGPEVKQEYSNLIIRPLFNSLRNKSRIVWNL